ncbi:class I SAM-dependent methyltransferase [Cochlodiniinecator piscidefendens]|uniref:class I SAM-dependent methyltransferase n=1 Tax=Cochlodiniinecator piscidefendens TaxID=2715756 RepID=UPI001407E4E3|nr:class I SAM-dependent methyltransferase [Cochlodiniinecator piscidefendens]
MVAPNTLTKEDFKLKGQVGRKGIATLIRLQELASSEGSYRYLEVGSYLGKSLQPHVEDSDCSYALSIDLRPDLTPDERGTVSDYEHVSTEDMLEGLRAHASKKQMSKLRTIDDTSACLRTSKPKVKFDLAFIDGEHTITAAFGDFLNVLEVMNDDCIVVFDDSHIIFPAVINARSYLESQNIPHDIRFGGGFITALFIGPNSVKKAEGFTDDLCLSEQLVRQRYEENIAISNVERYMTQRLRQDPLIRQKALRTFKNLGYQITEAEKV